MDNGRSLIEATYLLRRVIRYAGVNAPVELTITVETLRDKYNLWASLRQSETLYREQSCASDPLTAEEGKLKVCGIELTIKSKEQTQFI